MYCSKLERLKTPFRRLVHIRDNYNTAGNRILEVMNILIKAMTTIINTCKA